jgi:hypothetical protein
LGVSLTSGFELTGRGDNDFGYVSMACYLPADVMLPDCPRCSCKQADARQRILLRSTRFFLGHVVSHDIGAWCSTTQTPDELIRLNTVQIIFGRRVVRSEFFDTSRCLLKTFYGFYPTTVSFEVVFEDFVPNRVSNGMSPIQKKERTRYH